MRGIEIEVGAEEEDGDSQVDDEKDSLENPETALVRTLVMAIVLGL